MKTFGFLLGGFALFLLVLAAWFGIAGQGGSGEVDGTRTAPAAAPRTPARVAAQLAEQTETAERIGVEGAGDAGQILFGDLHVHSTLSGDAFMMNLPLMGGAGAMTPADACDFARHCAALDFWSINDHANSLHPSDWRNTVDTIRQCNARAGDPANPDTVAFLGWEWTQAGLTPDGHYGHKNVVLAHLDDARIPSRPIAAKRADTLLGGASPILRGALGRIDDRFDDLSARIATQRDSTYCGEGHVRELDPNCREVAETPPELFRKLDEWGHDALVIPHGTAWGIYTPPTSNWSKQLEGAMHDPDRQTLLEVYSGHGDSEVHRDWRPIETAANGEPVCPEARPDYLPVCRQAGEIIRARCLDEGASEQECEGRAELARRHAVAAGKDALLTIEGASTKTWLDAGQCRDCDQPAFNYVPTGSAQYIAALGHFDEDPNAPRRFRLGFMASSDNHSARPGTGYKERRAFSDGGFDRPDEAPPIGLRLRANMGGGDDDGPAHSRAIEIGETSPLSAAANAERAGSFQYTGGLIAVHAAGRDRGAIWDSMERLEVYGTSGPRILLWFDLLTKTGEVPMGATVESRATPTFRVRAVGSREQKPGCPDASRDALGPEELERLCLGECYHPGDTRRPIERIDVIRIRPQVTPDEDIASLIDDPWQRFECPGDPEGCTATFSDPSFAEGGRDAVYYARVYEAEIATANGDPLRCERDPEGRCLSTSICAIEDECQGPDRPRAWSSPIYVDHPDARRTR